MSIYKSSSLAMIPTAYKDGKLYSVRPTDGSGDFTFSRGSNLAATRVDVNGLIEKGRENLLTYSNEYSNAVWVKSNTSVTSGQSGYDSTNNAWLLSKTAANASIRQNTTQIGVVTSSFYLKSGTLNWAFLYLDPTSGTDPSAYINLNDGSVGTTSASVVDVTTESAGGGWYRCSITANITTIAAFFVFPADSDGNISGTSGNILIQDAQLEQGLVATDYIEATTASAQSGILEDLPRLDYSGGASCPSLLLEPLRTNLLTQSEYFGDSSWVKYNQGLGSAPIVTPNYATSPDGTLNASRLQCDLNSGTTTNDRSWLYSSVTALVGDNSFSLYVKNNSSQSTTFSLTNGSSETVVIAADSEWHRLYTVKSGGGQPRIGLIGGVSASDTCDLLIYGASLEPSASYPTSYIPTYGSAVTRSQDSCLATGISDLIGQTEGTMFFEIDQPYTDGVKGAWAISDGSSTNRLTMNTLDVNATTFKLSIATNYAGGSTKLASVDKTYGLHKVVIQYSGTTLKLFVDGALADSVTTDGFGNFTNFYVGGNQTGVGDEIREIKQALLFPTALTDSECIALTTI